MDEEYYDSADSDSLDQAELEVALYSQIHFESALGVDDALEEYCGNRRTMSSSASNSNLLGVKTNELCSINKIVKDKPYVDTVPVPSIAGNINVNVHNYEPRTLSMNSSKYLDDFQGDLFVIDRGPKAISDNGRNLNNEKKNDKENCSSTDAKAKVFRFDSKSNKTISVSEKAASHQADLATNHNQPTFDFDTNVRETTKPSSQQSTEASSSRNIKKKKAIYSAKSSIPLTLNSEQEVTKQKVALEPVVPSVRVRKPKHVNVVYKQVSDTDSEYSDCSVDSSPGKSSKTPTNVNKTGKVSTNLHKNSKSSTSECQTESSFTNVKSLNNSNVSQPALETSLVKDKKDEKFRDSQNLDNLHPPECHYDSVDEMISQIEEDVIELSGMSSSDDENILFKDFTVKSSWTIEDADSDASKSYKNKNKKQKDVVTVSFDDECITLDDSVIESQEDQIVGKGENKVDNKDGKNMENESQIVIEDKVVISDDDDIDSDTDFERTIEAYKKNELVISENEDCDNNDSDSPSEINNGNHEDRNDNIECNGIDEDADSDEESKEDATVPDEASEDDSQSDDETSDDSDSSGDSEEEADMDHMLSHTDPTLQFNLDDDGKTLLKAPSPKEDKWHINEADQNTQWNKITQRFSRYFIAKECRNCKEQGHMSRDCPKPPQKRCAYCAEIGHSHQQCPVGLCFNCNQAGHRKQDCRERRVDFRQTCQRCWMTGHSEDLCPDQWRQFLGSVGCGLVEVDVPSKVKANINYCYNCGRSGHLGHECRQKRVSDFVSASYPFIARFDVNSRSLYRCMGWKRPHDKHTGSRDSRDRRKRKRSPTRKDYGDYYDAPSPKRQRRKDYKEKESRARRKQTSRAQEMRTKERGYGWNERHHKRIESNNHYEEEYDSHEEYMNHQVSNNEWWNKDKKGWKDKRRQKSGKNNNYYENEYDSHEEYMNHQVSSNEWWNKEKKGWKDKRRQKSDSRSRQHKESAEQGNLNLNFEIHQSWNNLHGGKSRDGPLLPTPGPSHELREEPNHDLSNFSRHSSHQKSKRRHRDSEDKRHKSHKREQDGWFNEPPPMSQTSWKQPSYAVENLSINVRNHSNKGSSDVGFDRRRVLQADSGNPKHQKKHKSRNIEFSKNSSGFRARNADFIKLAGNCKRNINKFR